MSDPRLVYDTHYTHDLLEPGRSTSWDRGIVAVRASLIATYARGGVLDLCCGTGVFLQDAADAGDWVAGLDFTEHLLLGSRRRLGTEAPSLVLGDAHATPFKDESFDTVVSFGSLYTVLDLSAVLDEVRRVLRPGGTAVLDLGNVRSLMTTLVRAHGTSSGWVAHHTVPTTELRRLVSSIGAIVEWRSFQLLPMLRSPRWRLLGLRPITHPGWRYLLGASVAGRMLDERLSSAPLLNRWAFRHLAVVRR